MSWCGRRGIGPAVLLLLVAAACGTDGGEPGGSGAISARCESRQGGSRWAGEYREAAVYGRDSVDDRTGLVEVGGVAAGDSLVYVYDAAQPRVVVLSAGLRPVRSFGRKGNGPGELMTVLDRGMRGANWRWLSLAGDTVVVFDGGRVHLFSPDGRFLEQRFSPLAGTPALSGRADRVVYTAGGLLSAEGGYDFRMDQRGWQRYEWTLALHRGGDTRTLASLRLAPLPAGGNGAPFIGPEQARPLWDVRSGCVVVTDGSGEWLVRASEAGEGMDTLRVPLPTVTTPRYDPAELERLMGPGGKYHRPSAPRRVAALAIDPDGYAWVLPWQDSTHVAGGVEVVRVSLQTGAAQRDTVPAFPAAFGPPGVYYSAVNDRASGQAFVARYDAGTGAPAARPGG